MYGPRGGGIAEREGSWHRIDIIEGTLGQGVRHARRLHRRQPARSSTRCAPMRRASSSPPPCRRRSAPRPRASIRHLKVAGRARRAAAPGARTKAVLSAAGLPVMPIATHIVPLLVGDPETLQDGQRPPARRARHLHPADQLPDRAARHRAAAHHADALSRRRDDRCAGRRACRCVGTARHESQPRTGGGVAFFHERIFLTRTGFHFA